MRKQYSRGCGRMSGLVLAVWFGVVTMPVASKSAEPVVQPPAVTFVSEAFVPGGVIPKKYTGDGIDVSPALKWSRLPKQAQSVAIVCDDPDAPSGTWVHWLVYDIPAAQGVLKESISASELKAMGAKQGRNSFGNTVYNGPAPPPGKAHRYFFKLYALSSKLNLPEAVNKSQLMQAMESKRLAESEFMATYAR